jgi:hypothetical protein
LGSPLDRVSWRTRSFSLRIGFSFRVFGLLK